MIVFKCKMCGGDLNIVGNEKVAECEYCGTKQTLPKFDDERKEGLYQRAGELLRNGDFDEARNIFEQVIAMDISDAEAYWSVVLCNYGIEYVEDPVSRKRIPTVNRTQFTPIFSDTYYKSALEHADTLQKEIYKREAEAIDEIQKGILNISKNEEPFDVFICYKESDHAGRRTFDSVIATELYNELTRDGYKVFFARITLEDKLGSAYEPYIFAALNSARVMVVLGSKPEYFSSTWVKNEWSRYLALIKKGERKTLIPAYKDMDPARLPEEFSFLQAQDLGKLGAVQDIVRGIGKIIDADKDDRSAKDTNVDTLIKRGNLALEDAEWKQASFFFEQALNLDAELAEAYIGKLMAEKCVKNFDELGYCRNLLEDSGNYLKAIRFADEELANKLKSANELIRKRNIALNTEEAYDTAIRLKSMAASSKEFLDVADRFEKLGNYRDSAEHAVDCRRMASESFKEQTYITGRRFMENGIRANTPYDLLKAVEAFDSIPGYKDANVLKTNCKNKIDLISSDLHKSKQNVKKTNNGAKGCIIGFVIVFGIIFATAVFTILSVASSMNSLF